MKRLKHRAKRLGAADVLLNALITVFAVINLLPLYWLVISSFKPSYAIVEVPPKWVVLEPYFKNYQKIFSTGNAGRWLSNSVLIAGLTTVGVVLVSCFAAYAFAKLRFPGRRALFLVFISTLMLPKEVYIVPLFQLMTKINLYETYTGVILPNLALPFGVFLLKQFFEGIPDSLRESAKIDGASELRIFRSIILPMSRPGIGALAILMFVQTWNDFLWQLIMASSNKMRPLQLAISAMQTSDSIDYGLRYAGACLCAVPMVLIFLFFQRYFTRGIALGAVKE